MDHATPPPPPAEGEAPARGPAIMLGLGLGGFVDGIVLHQVLQWHHMVSDVKPVDTVAGLEVNTLADGFFHLGTWFLVVGGTLAMVATWRQGRMAPSWGFQLGLMLAGWGIFNVVEGLVNHQLLGVHHVRDDLGAPLSWDLGFLASGGLLIAAGWLWHRRGLAEMERPATPRRGGPEM